MTPNASLLALAVLAAASAAVAAPGDEPPAAPPGAEGAAAEAAGDRPEDAEAGEDAADDEADDPDDPDAALEDEPDEEDAASDEDPPGLAIHGWLRAGVHGNLDGAERDGYRDNDDRPRVLRIPQAALSARWTPKEDAPLAPGAYVLAFWGSDARDTRPAGFDLGGSGRGERFDVLEALVSFAPSARLPLRIEAGRWISPHGWESIEAPETTLPSRGFLYTFGTPTSHVGVRGIATLDDRTEASWGVVRGWDQWSDPGATRNHQFTFERASDGADPGVDAYLTLGPAEGGGDRMRVLVDAAVYGNPGGGDVEVGLTALRGTEERAAVGGGTARWGGVGIYVDAPLHPRLDGAARIEWFRDEGGSRTGSDTRLLGVTVGVTARPFGACDNVSVRLEARWDRDLRRRSFDGGERRDQGTVALDWIVEF